MDDNQTVEPTYYDGTKLLSLKDINGKKPEVFICTTNRTGGKTTFYSRMLINGFKKKGRKFAILYRYSYELDDCAEKFFADIKGLYFPTDVLESKSKSRGVYHELYLNEECCGYAIPINSADQIKRMSHLFNDVEIIFFDEFQSESGKYCSLEMRKFCSIHQSIARGQGKQVRYVPVIMCANAITLLNPYYVTLGISDRLREDTTYMRGDGFVLEQGFVESASNAQKESGFNRAFASERYTEALAYGKSGVYLNDNKAFIEKPTGKSTYVATLKYEGNCYAIREYTEAGIMYADDHADETFPLKITVTTDDHEINYVMLKRNDVFLSNMRYFWERGVFRFKNLQCKNVILNTLSY